MKRAIFLLLIGLCLIATAQSAQFSGDVGAARRASAALRNSFCLENKADADCQVDAVRVIDDWAWFTWVMGEAGGVAIVHRQQGGWKILYSTGGWITPHDPEVAKVVPQAVAEILIPFGWMLNIQDIHRAINPSDLQDLDAWELLVMRNSIYASHGRPFTNPRLRAYFESWPWYHVDPNYSDATLTPIDKANVELILRAERRLK